MRRWRRTKAFCRWAGLICCVAILVAWITSLSRQVGVHRMSGTWEHWAGIVGGTAYVAAFEDLLPGTRTTWGLEVKPNRYPPRWWLDIYHNQRFSRYVLPLWMPFLPLAAFVGWLWLPRRRFGESTCQHCGYSLAGLAPELPCPECGRDDPR